MPFVYAFAFTSLSELWGGPSGNSIATSQLSLIGAFPYQGRVVDVDVNGTERGTWITPSLSLVGTTGNPGVPGFGAELYLGDTGLWQATTYGTASPFPVALQGVGFYDLVLDGSASPRLLAFGGTGPGDFRIWEIAPDGSVTVLLELDRGDPPNTFPGSMALGRGGSFGRDLYYSVGNAICRFIFP